MHVLMEEILQAEPDFADVHQEEQESPRLVPTRPVSVNQALTRLLRFSFREDHYERAPAI